MDVHVLRTPVRAPKANARCERLAGTVRRECPDFLIPLNVRHLKAILKNWVSRSNSGRPHMSLGPGIPHVRLYARPPGQIGERRLRLEARRRRNVRFRGKGPDFWRACEPGGVALPSDSLRRIEASGPMYSQKEL